MDKVFLVALLVVIIAIYQKWSYKQWARRCERDVIPFTGKWR